MIICIAGPSGIGKTKLSIELAKKYNAIIINGDAMQVYKGLNIGTAKITDQEKQNIPHYLFDIVDVNHEYSIYEYQNNIRKVINDNIDKNIIIVGGSGLYIKAALYDYQLDERIKNEYEDLTDNELYQMVIAKDSQTNIHINNRKRMISFLNSNLIEKKANKLLYDVIFIGLTIDRNQLYEIVDRRVDIMLENGLLAEVKTFYDKNIRSRAIMTAIGYKEIYDYLDNKISYEEAIEQIKKNTRHFIKRQYTWFNNQMNINWFNVDLDNFNNTVNEIVNFIQSIHDKH